MGIELSVVILCYRAEKRLYDFVDRVKRLLRENAHSWEVVLVGNYIEGSNDITPSVVKEIASKNENVVAIALPKEGMMGWDARMGLRRARGNFVCLIDGDEQMPPEDIIRVYKKIRDENLDLVMTYRKKRYDGFMRKANSRIYNFIARILFPGIKVKDINSKPKIITREAYEKMHLSSNDWFIDAEMVIAARRLGLKAGQVPTEFFKCEYRKSFVKPETILEFIRNLIQSRVREFFKR